MNENVNYTQAQKGVDIYKLGNSSQSSSLRGKVSCAESFYAVIFGLVFPHLATRGRLPLEFAVPIAAMELRHQNTPRNATRGDGTPSNFERDLS